MTQAVIFKEIFNQVHKDLNCELFCFELKRHDISLYICCLATDNIYTVPENDNIVLIKEFKEVINIRFPRNKHLTETSYNRLKSKETAFQQYRENPVKTGVFRRVTNVQEHQRYCYVFDNLLLFTESIQETTQIPPH